VELIGLVLVFLAILLVCLVSARPDLPKRIGRGLIDGLESAGPCFAVGTTAPDDAGVGAEAKPADEAAATETTVIGQLFDHTITQADYHVAMAELARVDAVRHPIRMP
jgi:hypothetical protein